MNFWVVLFILLGLWCVIAPNSVVDFKVKTAKMVGATLKISKKTIKFYRYLGVLFILLGLFLLLA